MERCRLKREGDEMQREGLLIREVRVVDRDEGWLVGGFD